MSTEIKTIHQAIVAVKEYGLNLQDVPESLRTARVCWAAVREDGRAFGYVPLNRRTPALNKFSARRIRDAEDEAEYEISRAQWLTDKKVQDDISMAERNAANAEW